MLEDGSDGLYISDAYHKAFLEVSDIAFLAFKTKILNL